MPLILIDGCEDVSSWTGATAASTTGRNGNGINTGTFAIPTIQQSNEFTVGCALRTGYSTATDLIKVYNATTSGNADLRLRISTAGALTVCRGFTATVILGPTANGVMPLNTWTYVEMQGKIHDTLGYVTVRLNGTVVALLTATGIDTQQGGTSGAVLIEQVILTATTPAPLGIDDVYIMMGTGDSFLGDITVETLYPDGDAGYGADQRVTIGTGSAANYVSAGSVGTKMTFGKAGRITQIRYHAVSSATYDLKIWNSGGTQVGGPYTSTSAIGYNTVTLGTPLAISAGVYTFAISSGSSLLPKNDTRQTFTNTTDCTVTDIVYTDTANVMPTNPFGGTFYVEPVFQPTFNAWVGSDADSVNNYLLVDETGTPSSADYTGSATTGAQDLYTLTDLTHTTGTIVGVCHQAYAAASDTGAKAFNIVNRRSSDTKSAPLALSSTYAPFHYALAQDPETSAAWTIANVNALQSGVEVPPIPWGNLLLWLDADDASTFSFGTGSAISQWNDKSTNARHATQATSGNRPTRSTGVQNGRAAVVAGAAQWLSSGSPSDGTVYPIDNLSVFVACKRTGGNATVSVVLNNGEPNTSGYGLMLRASGANIGLLRCGVAVEGTTTADPAAAGVLTLQRTSGTWAMWLNGTATSLSTTGIVGSPSTPMYVPTKEVNHEFQGHIYEVIVYDRVLNTTERGTVEAYLKTKWGTP